MWKHLIGRAMSRGPGRIERVIEAAFQAEPSRAFTGEDLIRLAFPGDYRSRMLSTEKTHRVSVYRAAHKVAARLLWGAMPGGEFGTGLTFYNPVDLRSYAQAHLRWLAAHDLRSSWNRSKLEDKLAALDDPSLPFEHRHCMAPGGSWWRIVEIVRCRHAGDDARADALEAQHDAALRAIMRGAPLPGAPQATAQ